MKKIKLTKDKFEVIGVSSIVFVVLGLISSGVALMTSLCSHVVGKGIDPTVMTLPERISQVSGFFAEGLLILGFVGAVFYQLTNLKNRDDLPTWWVLIWFEAFALFTLIVINFPGLYLSILNLIFKG